MDTIRLFSEELEELEVALGNLLKDILFSVEENSFPDRAAMLELRVQYLSRRVILMLQKMQELSDLRLSGDQITSGGQGENASIKDLPLSILAQQILLAEQQKMSLSQLSESLEEMRRAKSATPKAEQLLLLRQLKDSLENYGKMNDKEPDGI